MGDRRLAERADADRGHRDPDLAGGDVVADLVELVQRQRRAAGALLGQRLEPLTPRADERVLRDHEERVDEDQQPVRTMNSAFTDGDRAVPARAGALLLRGRSSSSLQRPGER